MTHFRQVLMNVNTAAIKADGRGSEENFKPFFKRLPPDTSRLTPYRIHHWKLSMNTRQWTRAESESGKKRAHTEDMKDRVLITPR